MSRSSICVYAQDRGGAQFLAPILPHIIKKFSHTYLKIITHPISETSFKKNDIPYEKLQDIVGTPPLSTEMWCDYLKEEQVEKVFCTTSSPYRDATNGALIEASRRLSIPTMGIMDHWKGFDRFSLQGRFTLPDKVCCIDSICARKFIEWGLTESNVHIVGHPYLEQIEKREWKRKEDGKFHVLLISQPVVSDKSFRGIFFRPFEDHRLLDEIIGVCDGCNLKGGKPIVLRLRPHPKEQTDFSDIPEVLIDKNENWENSLQENDLFIGFDSMALVEAEVAGKYSISLHFPNDAHDGADELPIPLLKRVPNVLELSNALQDAVRHERIDGGKKESISVFEGSNRRALQAIFAFLSEPLSKV